MSFFALAGPPSVEYAGVSPIRIYFGAAGFMSAYLVPYDELGSLVPLDKAIILVGRQSDCDLVLDKSRKVSRRHCCLAQVDNYFVVRDLGSTNGVTVNGQKIQADTRLELGDDVQIGDVRFRFQSEAASRADSAPNPEADPIKTNSSADAARKGQQPLISSDLPVVIDDYSDELDGDLPKLVNP